MFNIQRFRYTTEPPEDRNKPDNCLLEIPGEAQLDGVVAGVIVALNLVIFVAEHEVRAIGDAELEAGLGSPGKLGGGNGSRTAAVFQSMNGGLHVAVSGADFAAQIEHGVVADGKVQRVTGHHRDIGGTEAGGIRPADAQVLHAGVVGTGQDAAVQGNLMNNAAGFNIVENAQIAAGHVGHGVFGGDSVSPFQGHAELAVVLVGMIGAGGRHGGRKGQT